MYTNKESIKMDIPELKPNREPDVLDILINEFFSETQDINSKAFINRKRAFRDWLSRGYVEACHKHYLCPLCGDVMELEQRGSTKDKIYKRYMCRCKSNSCDYFRDI